MRITIRTGALLAALVELAPAITKSTLPVLSNVKIEGNRDNKLVVTGTDLDRNMTTTVDCQTDWAGGTTLPHAILTKLLKKLDPETDITLSIEGGNPGVCLVQCGTVRLTLPTVHVDEFPPEPSVDTIHTIAVDGAELGKALAGAAFCMSTDESRYVLNGVLLSVARRDLNVVATDGRRLSHSELSISVPWLDREPAKGESLPEGGMTKVDLIVPAETVGILQKLLAPPKGEDETVPDVHLCLPKVTPVDPPKLIRITIGEVELFTKLVEGNYPNYRVVIPNDATHCVSIPAVAITEAMARVAIISESVKLKFGWGNITIEAIEKTNSSRIIDEVPCTVNYGKLDGFEICFNSEYLLEACKAATAEGTITMKFIDPLAPGVITGVDNVSWTHVLMPMRLDGAKKEEEEAQEPATPATEPTETAAQPEAEAETEETATAAA